jgi:hypothetical protein
MSTSVRGRIFVSERIRVRSRFKWFLWFLLMDVRCCVNGHVLCRHPRNGLRWVKEQTDHELSSLETTGEAGKCLWRLGLRANTMRQTNVERGLTLGIVYSFSLYPSFGILQITTFRRLDLAQTLRLYLSNGIVRESVTRLLIFGRKQILYPKHFIL